MPAVPGPAAFDSWLSGALFAPVGRFIADHALSPAFARAAACTCTRDAHWHAHWHALRRHPIADLRIGLGFVLACDLLGLDTERGLAFAREAAHPARWMRLFLADHGLMAYDAFDVDPCVRVVPAPPPIPAAVPRAAAARSPALSPRRTTRARAPRRDAAPA